MVTIVLLSIAIVLMLVGILLVSIIRPPFISKILSKGIKPRVFVMPLAVVAALLLVLLVVQVTKLDKPSTDLAKEPEKPVEDPVEVPIPASEVKVESVKVYLDNDKKYNYEFAGNSRYYTVKVQLLDVSKNVIDEKEILGIENVWKVTTKQPRSVVAYYTYAIKDGEEYTPTSEIIPISKVFMDYPKIANSVKIVNTKIIKEDDEYQYVFSFSSVDYAVRLVFMGKEAGDNLLERVVNLTESTTTVTTDQLPIIKKIKTGGTVSYIRARISIDGNFYDQSKKIPLATVYQDKDAERLAAEKKKAADDQLCMKVNTKSSKLSRAQKIYCGNLDYPDYKSYKGKKV